MVLILQKRARPGTSCFSVSCPVGNKVAVLPLGLRGIVVQFFYEAGLINNENTEVDLTGAIPT